MVRNAARAARHNRHAGCHRSCYGRPCGRRGDDRWHGLRVRRHGNPVNTIVSSHNTQGGWTVGGGLEGRLASNWTAKIEYLYFDLGTVTTIPAPTPGATTAVAFNSRITDNIVRVGINYKFDAADIWTNY
jgi:opacity protein-like surface antigen